MRLLGPVLREMRWLAIFSVATNLLVLAMPLHMMAIYDRVLTSGSIDTLVYITLIALGALAILGVGEALRLVIAQRAAARIVAVHGDELMRGALARPEADPAKGPRELQGLRAFVASRGFVSLFDLPFAPLFAALMFWLHPFLGILTVCGIALLALVAVAQTVLGRASSDEAARRSADLSAFTNTALRQRETGEAMGMGPAIVSRWGAATARALTAADAAGGISAIAFGLSRFARQGLQVLILATGAWLVLDGQLSGGVIFAASIIFGRAIGPIEQLITGWERVARAREDAAALTTTLRDAPNDAEGALGKPLGRIALQSVGVCVDDGAGNGRTILRDVSFEMEPGRVCAVIGPNGGGKTSLARVIAGALPASSGTVRLDGYDPRDWSPERRARTVGYVAQDVQLFPGTVADNIARLSDDVDEERIVWAARFAGAHDMIAALSRGYATPVGEGVEGRGLTGGQRQLIGLARAVVTRPRLLVLDEPNAHLDQHSEAHMLRALTNARHEGTSVVVVTQRRSLLQIADYIATVNGGTLVSMEENRGQWKGRGGDEARRDALHDAARQDAQRTNAALSLADQLSRSLGLPVNAA